MKNTGIVRRIEDLGRTVIQKGTRRTHGLKEGDPMEICVDGCNIVLQKYQHDGSAALAVALAALRLAAKETGKKPAEYLQAAKEKNGWKI